MATVTTTKFVKATESREPFAMMQQKGIFTRLVEEVSLAAKSFSQDPHAFVKELFFDEAKDLQRKKLIRTGLILAVVFHIIAGIFIATVKWHRNSVTEQAREKVYWVPPLDPNKPPPDKPETESIPRNDTKTKQEGLSGGDKSAASSGGGLQDPTPANKGVPPQLSPIPSVIPPTAPSVSNLSLPVNPSLKGDTETPPPPPGETLGSPTGTGTTPSGGTGGKDGIGEGNNGGVGNKSGPGAGNENGNGHPGGTGGNGGISGGSTIPSAIRYVDLAKYPNSGIVWIRRVRPIVTPEAQDNKVYGYVLLEATFNADGTITDIVVRVHLQGMDAAAIEALQRAKFRPATIQGQPVTLYKVPIKVPVNVESS